MTFTSSVDAGVLDFLLYSLYFKMGGVKTLRPEFPEPTFIVMTLKELRNQFIAVTVITTAAFIVAVTLIWWVLV